MTGLYDSILAQLTAINWDGPAAFVALILFILLIFRKWSMFWLIVLTIALSWGAQDMIIMNIESKQQVISLPLVIYIVGGGTVLILAAYSFLKMSVK